MARAKSHRRRGDTPLSGVVPPLNIMKITIEAEAEDKDVELEFSNESIDNDNFVDMKIKDDYYTITVDDLYSAVMAFKIQREERLKKESLMEE